MLFYLAIFVLGITGMILSIIAQRTKNKTILFVSIAPVALTVLIVFLYREMFIYLFETGNIFGFIIAAFIIVPVIFWIMFLQKIDNPTGQPVTNDYLDEIINSDEVYEDEEYD